MAGTARLKDHWAEQRLFARRIVAATFVIVALVAALGARLFYLQVVKHEYFTDLSQGNRIRIDPLPPSRGLILDRTGDLLATNRPAYPRNIGATADLSRDRRLHFRFPRAHHPGITESVPGDGRRRTLPAGIRPVASTLPDAGAGARPAGGLGLGLLAWGSYGELLDWVVFADWLTFGTVALSLLVYRRRGPGTPGFRDPLYPWSVGLFVLAAAWVIVGSVRSNPGNAIKGVAMIAAGVPVYLWSSRWNGGRPEGQERGRQA